MKWVSAFRPGGNPRDLPRTIAETAIPTKNDYVPSTAAQLTTIATPTTRTSATQNGA